MQPPDPNQPPQPYEPLQPAPIPAYNQPLPPQGYAPPARPGGPPGAYPGGYGPPPPKVRFDAINEAWKLFQAEMGTWILTGVAFGVIMLALMAFFFLSMFSAMMPLLKTPAGTPPPAMTGAALTQMVSSYFLMYVLIGLASIFIQGGTMRMAIKQIRGEKISVGDAFSLGDVFWPLLGAGLLVGLCFLVGYMLCFVPGLIVMGTLMFAIPLVVDGRLGAGAAVSKSWETLKVQLWPATGFYLVVAILAQLGSMACYIGALFTMPLLPLSIAVLYRDFFITPRPGEIQISSTDSGSGPPIPEAG